MIRFICQVFFTFIIECHWIFFTIQESTVCGSYIVIPQEEEAWLNAARICNNTYKGKLLSSVKGSKQKMECLYNYTSNVKLWSRRGLILSPYLSHEGCFDIPNELNNQAEKFSHTQSVGECYIHCKGRTRFFGITNATCYCITDSEKSTLQRTSYSRCQHTCIGSTDEKIEFCGGTMTLNLYTDNLQQVLGDRGNERCAVIACLYPDYHLSAQTCDSKFKYVCADEQYHNNGSVNFTKASSLCISRYMNYLSPSLKELCTSSHSQRGSRYWLDVQRYWARTSDIPYNMYTREIEFKCGYFLSGISEKMGFQDNCINNRMKRRYACETDAAPTQGTFFSCSLQSKDTQALDTTTQSQSQSPQLDSSASTRVTTGQSKEIASITHKQDTSITTEGYIDLISMNRSQSGSSSAIIGAVVGVLVTSGLVVGFIIFLVLRRRKKKQREKSKSEEIIASQESKNNFKLEEKQNALQSYETDQENRHYFQLEANPKHNIDVGSPPQVHLRGIDEYNEADDTVYHETGNDVYDHLNQKRKKTDNEDMYHIANGFQSDNDEYQHIHSLKGVTNRESSSDYAKFNEDKYSAIQRDK